MGRFFLFLSHESLKEFHEVFYDNEPSILVVFQNIPEKQMIAIEKASEVFSSIDAVAEFIQKTLRYLLHEYKLMPYIRNIFDEKEFWALIADYKNRIKFIRFEFVKENNEELYKSIAGDLIDWTNEVNSHKTVLQITAPDEGVLENINQQNTQLNGMVHSASLGTSLVKVKVAEMKNTISTKGKTVKKEFKGLEIEGRDVNDVNFILQNIFKQIEK